MKDDELRDLVMAHDKHIDLMAQSVERVSESVNATTRKLDDVIDVINTQNVLMEKYSNLEVNIKESFDRVYERIRAIERTHNDNGCPALQLSVQKTKTNEVRIKKLEASLSWVVKIVIGTLISGLIGLLFFLAKAH